MRVVFQLIFCLAPCLPSTSWTAERPNILWLSAEDISPHLGCYGDPHANTPRLDALAAEGARYSRAFTVAGVCAPNRSAMITGMYQTSIGTQHMRCRAELPAFIEPFPAKLRRAGYYCSNNSKEDYQFQTPKDVWDDSSSQGHWRNRESADQPFFAVFNFGGCHESGIARDSKYRSVTADLPEEFRQDADALTTFPPYYPESPEAREDWKRNYELISAMDAWAGDLIDQLKSDGLYDNTIIFFWSDHGVGLPRAKRWLYDSGTHIPLIVRLPEAYRIGDQGEPGTVTDRLVSSIDFAPTALNLAGVEIPEIMQGRAFLGRDLFAPRNYVYGARDRMDERYDIIRMVRDKRYKYIRNYEPLKTYYQYMNTPEKGATMMSLRTRFEAGTLNPIASRYFAPTKPVEELYDTKADPHEIHNLADSEAHQVVLVRLRSAHMDWASRTGDLGLVPEPILDSVEEDLGYRYGATRIAKRPGYRDQLLEAAIAASSSGPEARGVLRSALEDPDPAIRYWGATGLGNLGEANDDELAALRDLLEDSESATRSAAALALLRIGEETEKALQVLAQELETGAQWERLMAAIALDEVNEKARPVLDEMRQALEPRTDLYANGKYVVRTINRAINELEGTQHIVP